MTTCHLPRGFSFAGIHCGIRPDPQRLDLALIASDPPAHAAGVFTRNQVVAAPVQVCRERLPSDRIKGVVICSGNANACTGERGLADARRMTEVAAEALHGRPEEFLVCSTGVIGRPLPMPAVEAGIRAAVPQLSADPVALDRAAQAILTTDTRTKVSARQLTLQGVPTVVTGFAKGAAMIGPNMATMLAFVLTDARVDSASLHQLARQAAAVSFNCVSVEGHTSTNDTLLLLANGTGERPPLDRDAAAALDAAVLDVCRDLARAIAADAEGATHFVTIEVEGTRTDEEAHRIAKAIADSALVKTAIFGADPNWGRIVSAAGYAGVAFRETDVSLWLGDTLLYERGTPLPFDAATVSACLKNTRDLTVRLQFSLGTGRCTFWTCDLGYDYIRLNADYTT